MTLLGWMHRKLKQNSIDPFKDAGSMYIGLSPQLSLYEHQNQPQSTFSSANSRLCQERCQISTTEVKTKEDVDGEEFSVGITTPFDGFLTIGTFGIEPTFSESSTPTFPRSFEEIYEKETDVTEIDLKFMSDVLEKFLEDEAKEVSDGSPDRTSHVSIVTICEKQIEDAAGTEERADLAVCPLQGYLFSSSIELPEATIQVKNDRTTLRQLFNMNIAYEDSKNNDEKVESHAKGTYSTRYIKKMLKKLRSYSKSSKASTAGSTSPDPVSTKRNISKVLRMFHKKVHPERSEEECLNLQKTEMQKNFTAGDCEEKNLPLQGRKGCCLPLKSMLKKETSNVKPAHKRLRGNAMTQKEHWVKTDAEYFVLEL